MLQSELDISWIWVSLYFKKENAHGKLERYHRTIKSTCIRVNTQLSLDDCKWLVTDFVDHYNTSMNKLITMLLAGQTQAGSVEVQPARDSRFKATNCRWDGGYNLPSHFTIRKDNSELCNALKNLIKRVPPKAVSLFAEGKKSLLTVKWICPIHAEPVQTQLFHLGSEIEKNKKFFGGTES